VSPEQRDYGHRESEDRALVPGTLTVFRHFQADLRSGVLMPMNYNPRNRDGFNSRPGQQPYTRPAGNLEPFYWEDGPHEPEQPVYQAQCDKLWRVSHITQFTQAARPDHDAPDKGCTCGFYASYDPETDFYPSFRWGRLYSEIVGATGYEDIAIVKAAVEVSGTVVMGRLGVRAGRMKIVGLTLDWEKRIRPGDIDGGGPYGWRRDPYYGGSRSTQSRYVVYNHQTGEYEMRQVEVKDEDEARDIAQADALASGYGATYYNSVAEMVEAHPMADVSALGVDTTPRPSEDYIGLQASLYGRMFTAQQLAQVEQAVRKASKTFQQAAASIAVSQLDVDADLLFGKPKPKRRKPKGGTMPEHLARALESKRKRQAPPGSGIDRRKKKL
jgi:hypothetical protein